ncbi:hypothetical protein [Labrenzia sp. CE80]|uniref:hypothetical protein n=1 Tax=Labrenzia sp. CE80 TaxID=1788986 RepID=UPI00129A4450|nr:hypothetical protein [Labrenzia sp. CE80]
MTFQIVEDLGLADLSDWPIAKVRFPEVDEKDRVTRLTETIDLLLARKEPFTIIWKVASHLPDEEPKEDDRNAHIWLKRVRKDLNEYVKGYAYIVQDPVMREILHERVEKVASKLFSFPIYITDNEQDAVRHASNWT